MVLHPVTWLVVTVVVQTIDSRKLLKDGRQFVSVSGELNPKNISVALINNMSVFLRPWPVSPDHGKMACLLALMTFLVMCWTHLPTVS